MANVYGKMKDEQRDYNLDMAGMNANEDTLAIQRTLRMKDHNIELGKLYEELTDCFGEEAQEQLGIFMGLNDGTAITSEQMDGSVLDMVTGVIDHLDKLGYMGENYEFLGHAAQTTAEDADAVKYSVDDAWQYLKDTTYDAAGPMGEAAFTLSDSLFQPLAELPEDVHGIAKEVPHGITRGFNEAKPDLVDDMFRFSTEVTDPLAQIPENAAGAITGTIDQMGGELEENKPLFMEQFNQFRRWPADAINEMPDLIGAPVTDSVRKLMDQADESEGPYITKIDDLMTGSVDTINNAPNLLGMPVTDIFGLLSGQIDNGQGSLLGKVAGLAGGATGQLNGMPSLLDNPMGFMLSALLAVANGYLGLFSNGSSQLVANITRPFSNMPTQSSSLMGNFLSPMLTAMNSAAPSLYTAAASIASGILTRLRRSFDINSPSRKTRAIFQSVMEGAELGLSDRTESLYGQTEGIASGVMDNLRGLAGRARATVAREMGGAQPAALWAGAASRLDALAGRGEELGLFRQMAEGLHKGGTQVEADLVLDGKAFGRLVTRLSDRGLGNRMRNTARLGVDVT